jgi:hypothetical protein
VEAIAAGTVETGAAVEGETTEASVALAVDALAAVGRIFRNKQA